MKTGDFVGATGRLVKALTNDTDREYFLPILRQGIISMSQWNGKKRGALSLLVENCSRRAGPPYSFSLLLDELEKEAARRNLYGVKESIIEKVDRVWEVVTFHHNSERKQVTFKTLRGHLTAAKKALNKNIP